MQTRILRSDFGQHTLEMQNLSLWTRIKSCRAQQEVLSGNRRSDKSNYWSIMASVSREHQQCCRCRMLNTSSCCSNVVRRLSRGPHVNQRHKNLTRSLSLVITSLAVIASNLSSKWRQPYLGQEVLFYNCRVLSLIKRNKVCIVTAWN